MLAKLFQFKFIIIVVFLFSEEAWVSRVYNKETNTESLLDQSSFVFKIEKLSDFEEATVKDKNGKTFKLNYLKAKIVEVFKNDDSTLTYSNSFSIVSPPKSGLYTFAVNSPAIGQVISIADQSPLEEKPPQGKSYYHLFIEYPPAPKEKTFLFFSRGYQKDLSVFFGSVQNGLVDLKQENVLKKALLSRLYFDAIRSQKIENLKSTISKHPKEINLVDELWGSPLQFAARYGKKEDINLLIQNGASLLTANSQGNNVLHDLVVSQFIDNLAFIIELSSDLNLKNKSGSTALHLAIENLAPIEIIKLLVQAGANSKIKDSKGKTAFDLAKDMNSPEILKIIETGEAD